MPPHLTKLLSLAGSSGMGPPAEPAVRGLQSAVHEAILLNDTKGLQRALQARGGGAWLAG